jgi:hypothetical protein
MAFHYSPRIPTRTMVFCLDAGNPNSAPDGGGAWYDLSGNNNSVSVYGSPVVTTLGGARCYNLNDVGDRFVCQTNAGAGITPTTNATLEAWIYPAASELSSGDRGCIIQGYIYLSWNKSNQKLSNYWYSTTSEGYHEPPNGVNRGEWNHFCSVWDYTNAALYQYVNGELVNTVSTQANPSLVNSNVNIGWEGDGRQFAGGFGLIKMYYGALTTAEVQQLYNSTKNRFGR